MARPKPHHPLFRGLFRHTVAVDLGTANTLIYTDDGGIVLNQPSVVCFQKHAMRGPEAGGGGGQARPSSCSAARRITSRRCGRCGMA